MGLSTRKFRRWNTVKSKSVRTAWNKILPSEHQAIVDASYNTKLLDKSVSHLFVHGHNTDKFYVSLSTVYKVLSEENIVRKQPNKHHKHNYLDAHTLLLFLPLCYKELTPI